MNRTTVTTNAADDNEASMVRPDEPGPKRLQGAIGQKVVIVNGSDDMLELLEDVLDTCCYDVVFVESDEHAYSQVKRVQPNLVILCVCIDDPTGFHVLSMLKLDPETRNIPVLTYTNEYEGREIEAKGTPPAEGERFASHPAVWMN
jgi:PleD family two-component response regulator